MGYSVFTRAHDLEIHLGEMMAERDVERDDYAGVEAAIAKRAPEGDPEIGEGAPVTILVDCSGSMRGDPMESVVAGLRKLGDALEAAGREFEILGFTTRTWKGGMPRDEWLAAGRPEKSGRLNALLHLVVKRVDITWSEARDDLVFLTTPGLHKENIDGEALEWAAGRIRARELGPMIVISDGVPMDDATIISNGPSILLDHARGVIAGMTDIPLHAVYLGDPQRMPGQELGWPGMEVMEGEFYNGPDHPNRTSSWIVKAVAEGIASLDARLASPEP